MKRWTPDPRCLGGMNWAPNGRYVEYEEYEKLLDQAIRFAETIVAYVPSGLPRAKEAKAFLDRPEVQARRKKDLPIQCDWDGTGFY